MIFQISFRINEHREAEIDEGEDETEPLTRGDSAAATTTATRRHTATEKDSAGLFAGEASPTTGFDDGGANGGRSRQASLTASDRRGSLAPGTILTPEQVEEHERQHSEADQKLPFGQRMGYLVCNTVFMLLALGYAAQAFVVGAVAYFGVQYADPLAASWDICPSAEISG